MPNGIIFISRAAMGRNAAAAEVTADCLMNSRLEISSISRLSVRQRPAVAILAPEILVRVARVGELHCLRVPEQCRGALVCAEGLSAVPDRGLRERDGLGTVGGIDEVAAGSRSSLDGRDPVRRESDTGVTRSRLRLRKSLRGAIILHLLRRNQLVVQD